MEVLGLDVNREHVCQRQSEGSRNILGGVGAEIARRVEWCLAALSRGLHTHFDPSFRVDTVLLFAGDGSEQAILRDRVCTFARTRPFDVDDATWSVPSSMTIYVGRRRLAPELLDQHRRGVARERLGRALVLPLVMFGMIEASITRRPSTPRTLSPASTTARASWPIRHVPIGCHIVVTTRWAICRSLNLAVSSCSTSSAAFMSVPPSSSPPI